MTELGELLREAWHNRRRLLPVVLGLGCGMLSLVVLLAFGDGFSTAMHAALARSGDRLLRWYGGSTSRPYEGRPAGRPVPLTVAEHELLANAPGVLAASPEVQLRARLIADEGGRPVNANTVAVGAQWAFARGRTVAPTGRFLSPIDEQERRRVIVLGGRLAVLLFGHADVIGRSVRLFDAPFLVVGVLPELATLMQYGGDDATKAIVPFTTVAAMRGLRRVDYVLTRIDPGSEPRQREREQRALLARRLGCDADDVAAVRCSNHAAQAGQIHVIVAATRGFLFVIGLLGLLVAAVAVANMTFALVEERRGEIGLRLAVGATPRQIWLRVLLETALVVTIGGLLGLLFGLLLLAGIGAIPLEEQVRGYLGEPTLSAASVLVVLAVLAACCGIAGHHPAARAAAIEPVEALRDE